MLKTSGWLITEAPRCAPSWQKTAQLTAVGRARLTNKNTSSKLSTPEFGIRWSSASEDTFTNAVVNQTTDPPTNQTSSYIYINTPIVLLLVIGLTIETTIVGISLFTPLKNPTVILGSRWSSTIVVN